jgi:NTE family protein
MKKSVSLVLSGGGARGVAHIGVIEELERQGYKIHSIAGSSMGAVVGGIYASGNLKVFSEWMCKLDKKAIFNLTDFTLSTNGIVKGNKIIKELKKIVPDINIEDLPISYVAVATDIKNEKEVVFENGSLYEAIRASMSIPAFFKPHKLNGMVLIDGGVLNPLPINRVKRNNNDLLIAVDVYAPLYSEIQARSIIKPFEEEKKLSYFKLFRKNGFKFNSTEKEEQLNYYTLLSLSTRLMIQQITAKTIEMYKPDILIEIPFKAHGGFEFFKSDEIIKSGELATRKALMMFQTKK